MIAAFDTRITDEEIDSDVFILCILVNIFGRPIADKLVKKAGQLIAPPEGFFVHGTEGPLKEGELERAIHWAKQILARQ